MSRFENERVDTGIEEAFAYLTSGSKSTRPSPDCFPPAVEAAQQSSSQLVKQIEADRLTRL